MYDKMGFVQWDKTTTVGEGWPEVSHSSSVSELPGSSCSSEDQR
jgi:hypothetical protein